MRVLIVDDEPLARENLRTLLASDEEVEVVGECASGAAAVQFLREHGVDLAFLDVRMPRLSGLDVVREVGPDAMPLVIFATAFDRYALDAFESQALDYLLKPFDDARFAAALARAKARWHEGREASLGRRLAALVEGREPDADDVGPARDERIVVRQRGRRVPVDVASIEWVEAADYCVRLHVGAERYLLRASMDDLERRLGEERFLRVHRSAIVRLDRVAEVRHEAGRSWIVLADRTCVPLSRRRRLLLERRLGG
ncbi:MAG: response regulator transcription factor [Planctomycetes bacterium]|nr:response regulator transcription factor [Planctomycetota bacterium]